MGMPHDQKKLIQSDKGKTERQHWSCNTEPILVKLRGPPLTICVKLEEPASIIVAIFLLLPRDEIIQFWIFLGVFKCVSQKHPTHITC